MNWTNIVAWAYGFVTPALTIGYVTGAFGLMMLYFELPERLTLPASSIWSGVGLFAGLAVLGIVIIAQLWK